MSVSYRTRDGDTVDLIAWRYYGRQDGQVVEQLLEANPGLADIGPILPPNVLLTIPDMPSPERIAGVRLWD